MKHLMMIIMAVPVALLAVSPAQAEDTYVPIDGEYVWIEDVRIQRIIPEEIVVQEQTITYTLRALDEHIASLEDEIIPNLAATRDEAIARLQAQIAQIEAGYPSRLQKLQAQLAKTKAVRARVAAEAAKVELVEAAQPEPVETGK